MSALAWFACGEVVLLFSVAALLRRVEHLERKVDQLAQRKAGGV